MGKVIACAIYCFGLIGMISASALYHFAMLPRRKRLFRRLDHHMIFVMIAGTYTPLSIAALRPDFGCRCAPSFGSPPLAALP